ncbi:chemotaxis protein methyltransferase CheR [Desulfatibacillum alkenivorans DSM 16219]|uniref:protein-glutamate O-methyltransferase n=1 Tax=Desulfatibacillum alkenivorans DSM 16219 TaxID=1121393 RepID=A0A1M6Y565_9BACT|nr:chemotaxis protein methyltransferase CheR [Desulfatibacillum alkenivorans DSM 16219]
MGGTILTLELTDNDFKRISTLVYAKSGINLHHGKKELVKARLGRRLRATGCQSFEEYFNLLRNEQEGVELVRMLDALTTNKTSFFREKNHFDYLEQVVFPEILERNRKKVKIRCWSAGCSSGEEPYSLAICISEYFRSAPYLDAKILATDLSTAILKQAADGVYSESKVQGIPITLLRRYFRKGFGRRDGYYQVKDRLRNMVTFKRHNLMEQASFLEPFDLIMCRNVMIYFDKATQHTLVNGFYRHLRKGGRLFVGHAESLTGIEHPFTYVQPTLYRK